ncbi:MAG: class I SAM-dependent methyltransferase [Acidimicrobiales bacterium]
MSVTDERRRYLESMVAANEIGWWHSIDFGDGVSTSGYKTRERLAHEVAEMRLPDLEGKTVLDIGAWDGFFSFEAERRGAERVVALDHFVWCLHTPKQHQYVDRCRQQGIEPKPYEEVPEIWDPVGLPGKSGFDIAHRVLDSRVESVVGDFMEVDLDRLGTFDVVFFLGVLYHMKHPFLALERLARLTKGMAVIETEAIEVPGFEDRALCEFFETDELAGDFTNWWAPNPSALAKLCRAAGFSRVETGAPSAMPPDQPPDEPSNPWRELIGRWLPAPAPQPTPELRRFRSTVHAYK